MTAQLAAKTNEVFEKIGLFLSEGLVPDEFTLKRIQRDAEAIIKNVDQSQGHVLLGALAAINLDYEGCRRHFDTAIKIDGYHLTHFINYAVSLNHINKSNEAYQIFESVISIFKNDADFLLNFMGTAIDSGNISQVSNLLALYNKLKPNDNSQKIKSIKEIEDYFIHAGVSDDIAKKLFLIASEVLIKNKITSHTSEFLIDDIDMFCWIIVHANVDKVVDMNMELCGQLADHPELNSNKIFSISYRAK